MTKSGTEESIEISSIPSDDNKLCRLITTYNKYEICSFYLNDNVGDIDSYMNLIRYLRHESPSCIFLYVNNEGGSLYTTIQIINAIKDCKVPVVGVLDGVAYSAAALIILACPYIMIKDPSVLMVHTYKIVSHGKSSEIQSQGRSYIKLFVELLKNVSNGFLHHEEIQRIIRGDDVYFHTKEITKRFKKLKKLCTLKDGKIVLE